MESRENDRKKGKGVLRSALSAVSGLQTCLMLVAAAVVVIGIVYVVYSLKGGNASLSSSSKDAGIMQLVELKEIGEWEFLSIEDEELVDTLRRGILSDDYLVRIYYGTLRLGFNMDDVADDWIRFDKDTLCVTLPAIRLLDERFIDEARTRAFYESGKWSDQDRADMYTRAYEKMIGRCLTQENLKSAEQNACRQIYRMLRALGYDDIRITFSGAHPN